MSEPQGVPVSQETWEQEYQSGRWKYLEGVAEMARYSVIAAYIRRFAAGGRLLDVGCGEGVLADYLDWNGIDHYTGIDISSSALQSARVPEGKRTLIVADLEEYEFEPSNVFDVIVFNEVLAYPKFPMKVFDKCAAQLAPNGIIVVSMWLSNEPNSAYGRAVGAIWKAIGESKWRGIDETGVINIPRQRTWRIALLCDPDRQLG